MRSLEEMAKCSQNVSCGQRDVSKCPVRRHIWKSIVKKLKKKSKELCFDSMNIGKSSRLGMHGFCSLHNLIWPCSPNGASWFDTNFVSQMKLTTFPLIHCFVLNLNELLPQYYDRLPLLQSQLCIIFHLLQMFEPWVFWPIILIHLVRRKCLYFWKKTPQISFVRPRHFLFEIFKSLYYI